MTPDGRFAAPPRLPFTTRLLGVAILIAVLTGAVALAALALWLAFTLIPIAVGAALIAYCVLRWKAWRARRASFSGQRDIFRS